MERYFARPASDHTEDCLWYVADRSMGNLNVTKRLAGGMFALREIARLIAEAANSGKIVPAY